MVYMMHGAIAAENGATLALQKWDTLTIRGAIQEYMHYALFKIKIMASTIFTN